MMNGQGDHDAVLRPGYWTSLLDPLNPKPLTRLLDPHSLNPKPLTRLLDIAP